MTGASVNQTIWPFPNIKQMPYSACLVEWLSFYQGHNFFFALLKTGTWRCGESIRLQPSRFKSLWPVKCLHDLNVGQCSLINIFCMEESLQIDSYSDWSNLSYDLKTITTTFLYPEGGSVFQDDYDPIHSTPQNSLMSMKMITYKLWSSSCQCFVQRLHYIT